MTMCSYNVWNGTRRKGGRPPAVASSDIPSSRGRLGDRNCPFRRGFRGAPAEFHAQTRCCNPPLAAVEISSGHCLLKP